MKYFKVGIIFLLFNFITVFVILHYADQTKKIEKNNKEIIEQISYFNEQLKINELEYSVHMNPTYLRKLEKIYFDDNIEENKKQNLVIIDNLSSRYIEKVFKVKSD